MHYLLDTNHASGLFRKLPKPQARVGSATGDTFLLCQPSIGELWFMVFNSSRVADNERDLLRFLDTFDNHEYDGVAAIEFGRIKSELRRIGRPIPDVDVQIAAIARIHGLTLLTADAHFAFVEGLTIENWLQ
jgi:tRNA(fMet)-specific endonuclease VapC